MWAWPVEHRAPSRRYCARTRGDTARRRVPTGARRLGGRVAPVSSTPPARGVARPLRSACRGASHPVQPSCRSCGARANAQASVCADCGHRFLEDSLPAPRISGAIPRTGAALASSCGPPARSRSSDLWPWWLPETLTRRATHAWIPWHRPPNPYKPGRARRPSVVRSRGGAPARGAVDFAARPRQRVRTRCSPLRPRPTDAIRRCRIRYPDGSARTVALLTNPRGQQLLIEP